MRTSDEWQQIKVTLPNIKDRANIFNAHLMPSKISIDKSELSRKMVALSFGLIGADIANVCNEAAVIAAGDSKDLIDFTHFKQAIERVINKKSEIFTPEKKTLNRISRSRSCRGRLVLRIRSSTSKSHHYSQRRSLGLYTTQGEIRILSK